MSPLPREFVNRWENRRDDAPGEGTVYWHILLGDHPLVRRNVQTAHDRLAEFTGLHLTPLRWLHITTLIAGPAGEISGEDMAEMLAKANTALAGLPPINVSLNRVLYHPEAIVLAVQPQDALTPILETAVAATHAATGREGIIANAPQSWTPHVTLCYSTARQPAEPIITALGKQLPAIEVSIDTLSLVVQRGPERQWDWHHAGTARLQGSHRSSLPA